MLTFFIFRKREVLKIKYQVKKRLVDIHSQLKPVMWETKKVDFLW